jgi:hypothetical protein
MHTEWIDLVGALVFTLSIILASTTTSYYDYLLFTSSEYFCSQNCHVAIAEIIISVATFTHSRSFATASIC